MNKIDLLALVLIGSIGLAAANHKKHPNHCRVSNTGSTTIAFSEFLLENKVTIENDDTKTMFIDKNDDMKVDKIVIKNKPYYKWGGSNFVNNAIDAPCYLFENIGKFLTYQTGGKTYLKERKEDLPKIREGQQLFDEALKVTYK